MDVEESTANVQLHSLTSESKKDDYDIPIKLLSYYILPLTLVHDLKLVIRLISSAKKAAECDCFNYYFPH